MEISMEIENIFSFNSDFFQAQEITFNPAPRLLFKVYFFFAASRNLALNFRDFLTLWILLTLRALWYLKTDGVRYPGSPLRPPTLA